MTVLTHGTLLYCRMNAPSPVHITNSEDGQLFLDGVLPIKISDVTQTAILGLFPDHLSKGTSKLLHRLWKILSPVLLSPRD